MDNRYQVWTGLLVGAIVAIISGTAWAQAPAVPGEAEAPNSEAPSAEAAMPNTAGVEAILATEPGTPTELVRAAKILADLERPDLARQFLKQVIDAFAGLDEAGRSAALVGLEERFGSPVFTEMAARADLAPEARQLNDAVLSAVRRHVQDPARLAGFVGQLKDPSAEVRYGAVVELQRAGSAAVGPLAPVLADASRAAEHANVRAALVQLGSDALDPLIAILESANAKLAVEAIRVLGDLANERAVVFLLAPSVSNESDPAVRGAAGAALMKLSGRVSSREVVVRLLTKRVEEYFERRYAMKEDVDGQVQVWTWEDGAKQLVETSLSADDASLLFAARLAREVHAVAPENEQIRRLYLATLLEQAAYEKGLDTPLELTEGTPGGRVAEFGVAEVEDLLAYALKNGHAPVAATAARILGREGDAETLLYRQARAAPLARATCDADRRVRLAAVEAILQLKPEQAFAGSSRVMETLAYVASSGGAPRALVAGSRTSESQRVGGYLVGLGYELETATSGREAIRKLLSSPDYELALVDSALGKPTVDFFLQELRHDCRTAKLPVGVLARAGQLARARLLTRRDPLAEAFPRPHTADVVQWQVERVLGLLGRDRILAAERERQAAQSLKLLADLTGGDLKFYDLRGAEDAALAALFVPPRAADAVVVLGNLSTPKSQRTLVDLASRWTQPIEIRAAAAQAFRRSIEQKGILLTTDQIRLQYDRYNQSETLDANSQQVLGLILDSIEAPSRIEKELKEGSAGDGQANTEIR
jgi:hypothetical protein